MVDLSIMEVPDFDPNKVNQNQNTQTEWPKSFPKTTIGLERKNVFTDDNYEYLPGALDSIKNNQIVWSKGDPTWDI